MLLKWLIIFSITFHAWGYNLTHDFINGFYWASLPISFMVVEQDISKKAELDELAKNAINEWEERTGLSLWDMPAGAASNIIRWSNNFEAETHMDASSVLAVAIRYTSGPYFAKSEIVINGSHPSFNTSLASVNKMNLATTLVHELGHTIGLDHSENMLAIMAPTLQYPYSGLHNDDVVGMNDVYDQTEHRQLTRYVSPLAYTKETSSSQPLSCGTIGPVSAASSANTFFSLGIGLLIGFVRKFLSWFKSLF